MHSPDHKKSLGDLGAYLGSLHSRIEEVVTVVGIDPSDQEQQHSFSVDDRNYTVTWNPVTGLDESPTSAPRSLLVSSGDGEMKFEFDGEGNATVSLDGQNICQINFTRAVAEFSFNITPEALGVQTGAHQGPLPNFELAAVIGNKAVDFVSDLRSYAYRRENENLQNVLNTSGPSGDMLRKLHGL